MGEKSLDSLRFSFVTVVSFVFENGFPVKNGGARLLYWNKWNYTIKQACHMSAE
jgi:hypothetical protein